MKTRSKIMRPSIGVEAVLMVISSSGLLFFYIQHKPALTVLYITNAIAADTTNSPTHASAAPVAPLP